MKHQIVKTNLDFSLPLKVAGAALAAPFVAPILAGKAVADTISKNKKKNATNSTGDVDSADKCEALHDHSISLNRDTHQPKEHDNTNNMHSHLSDSINISRAVHDEDLIDVNKPQKYYLHEFSNIKIIDCGICRR